MNTEKLYFTDPFLFTFEASLVRVAEWQGRPSLVFDRTAFYPEAGGQLADRGTLRVGDSPFVVEDVQIDDEGTIHHLVAGALEPLVAGSAVRGELDAARRRDHMSQHTGQHMLSRALLDVLGAETVSSRLGATSSTIDLKIAAAADALIARAEDLVGAVVLDDRPVRSLFPTPAELAAMKLRREPKVDRNVRVIEVEGFDLSPCGGTHVTRTGQVGPVHVTGVERYKGNVRVTFLAGRRALDDYRAKDAALGELSRSFTCGPFDVSAAVGKLRGDLKARGDALSAARGELMLRLAEGLLADAPADRSGTTRIVVAREGDDLGALRALAARIASRPDAVALTASRDRESGDWLVVVERGKEASFDAGAWMKSLASAHGGRGGGRPERAEGRLPATIDWASVARG